MSEMRDILAARLRDFSGMDAMLRFDLGDDGVIDIDATETPPVLLEDGTSTDGGDGGDPDCTIRLSAENLQKLMDGSLNPMFAYTMGKLKIEGSLGLAMKLASRLED